MEGDNKKIVFTSDKVINCHIDIIFISRNEDETFEAWGNEFISENDVKIISFEQLLKIDPSAEFALSLKEGMSASRLNKKSEWITNVEN